MALEVSVPCGASAVFALALVKQMRLTGKKAEYRWQPTWLGGVCGVRYLAPLGVERGSRDRGKNVAQATLIVTAMKKSGQKPAIEVAGKP